MMQHAKLQYDQQAVHISVSLICYESNLFRFLLIILWHIPCMCVCCLAPGFAHKECHQEEL